jgi:hypothetical protein
MNSLQVFMPATLGLVLDRAVQQIDFRLDAAGATVTSESVMTPKADPRWFSADGPFLVVMRKRGSAFPPSPPRGGFAAVGRVLVFWGTGGAPRPFFALWVDDGELLEPWREDAPGGRDRPSIE